MKKLIAHIVFVLAASASMFAQTPFGLDKVKEIKLLESSREDVRRIFAGYKLETDEDLKYEDSFYTDDANIQIFYSEGKCDDEEPVGFNVPEWKTVGVTIHLKKSIKLEAAESLFSTIGTRPSKLKKEKIYDNDDAIFLYHNKDLGIGFHTEDGEIDTVYVQPSKKYYSLMCDKKAAKTLSRTKSWFSRPLKDRRVISHSNGIPDVTNLILSLQEITADCSAFASEQKANCSSGVKIIAVFATGEDPENDVITFDFKVSGGKIIDEGKVFTWNMPKRFLLGSGKKVLWDLSGVRPGTYTITAAVDDGCGFCGQTRTRTVVVKDCADCGKN